jgi:acyl-coenzyme A thioesterase PaaI-like protein
MAEPETAPSGFAEEVGVEWIDLDPDNARARIRIEPRHLQPFGIVHGGVYASLAKSVDVTDDEGRLCALSRMTIAVRLQR